MAVLTSEGGPPGDRRAGRQLQTGGALPPTPGELSLIMPQMLTLGAADSAKSSPHFSFWWSSASRFDRAPPPKGLGGAACGFSQAVVMTSPGSFSLGNGMHFSPCCDAVEYHQPNKEWNINSHGPAIVTRAVK